MAENRNNMVVGILSEDIEIVIAYITVLAKYFLDI